MMQLSTRPVVRFATGTVKVTCDGNSLTAGSGATTTAKRYPNVLATLEPLASASTPVGNLGIGGQTSADMMARSDVTAAFDSGKTNILLAWEITNSLYLGRTAQQAVDDLLTYVSTVKASQAWRVAVMTVVPRYQRRNADGSFNQSAVDAYNAVIDDANTKLRAQYKGVADLLIELRPAGSPFDMANYLPATFDAAGMYIQESVDGGTIRTHLNDSGYAAVAQTVAAALRRMPKR